MATPWRIDSDRAHFADRQTAAADRPSQRSRAVSVGSRSRAGPSRAGIRSLRDSLHACRDPSARRRRWRGSTAVAISAGGGSGYPIKRVAIERPRIGVALADEEGDDHVAGTQRSRRGRRGSARAQADRRAGARRGVEGALDVSIGRRRAIPSSTRPRAIRDAFLRVDLFEVRDRCGGIVRVDRRLTSNVEAHLRSAPTGD